MSIVNAAVDDEDAQIIRSAQTNGVQAGDENCDGRDSRNRVREAKAGSEYEGPFGVTLRAIRVRQTPTRHSALFAVHIDGRETNLEWSVSTASTRLRHAMDDLVEIVARAKRPVALTKDQVQELHFWVRSIVRTEVLESLSKLLATEKAVAVSTTGKTVFDIALPYMRESMGLVFVSPDGRLWSERHGRFFNRPEFVQSMDKRLLELIQQADDYPFPTPNDPMKPIKQVHYALKVCFSELLQSLPNELQADLGPDSKAAFAFGMSIRQIWQRPETWMKCDSASGNTGFAERMSLAARARLLAQSEKRDSPWKLVLRGVKAFYCLDAKGEVMLGMRWELCRGQIGRIDLDNINSQAELSTLLGRYGLANPDCPSDRTRDQEHRQQRVAVLSRDICQQLIHGTDDIDGG